MHDNDILHAVSRFLPSSRNKKLVDTAIEFGARMLLADAFSPMSSGIVIAGFGSDEIFPSMAHYETDGYVGAQVKFSKPHYTVVTKQMTAAVTAFAQHEIVDRFMEGIDPAYSDFLRGVFRTGLVETNLRTFRKWAPKTKQNAKTVRSVERAADKQYQAILRRSLDYRRSSFSAPTVQMVSMLPKDDLAHLAESLVELTSLHRRVSKELETVGGPIDVAIISKGDGFIWYKRKHYFSLELNRHFELNYMRGVNRRT